MDASKQNWCLLLVLGILVEIQQGFVTASGQTAEKKLRQQLFGSYEKSVRPVLKPNQFVNVSFAYKLSKIVHLDNKGQLLTTDAWILQEWHNPFLIWNETDNGGIHTIHVLPSEVWVPDIVLYNNGDQDVSLSGFVEKFKTYVILESNGRSNWMSPATFKSSCTLEIEYFPFDTQTCHLTFGSWTYDNRMLKLWNLHNDHSFADKYTSSGEWDIEKVEVKRTDKKYDCCEHPFSDVTYSFTIKRKYLYYVIYLIVPCLVIALLIVLNFAVPAESGERIGFCITLLLAMSVYLLLVADSLPKTSNKVPLIGLYYMLTMFEIALALIATVVTLRCHYSNGQPPTWLIRLTSRKQNSEVKVFVKSLNDKPRDREDGESDKEQKNGGGEAVAVLSALLHQQKEESAKKDQWNYISRVVDNFFVVFFSFLSIVIALGVLVFSRV